VKENPQKPVSFEVVNIFDHETKLLDILAKQSHRRLENAKVDIIVSNPPYISQESFRTETTRSVRNWEPKLALVPENLHPETMAMGCAAADIFYQRLLYLYSLFRARILLMEVGDEAQAVRVAQMALSSSRIRRTTKGRDVVEIWRDSPDTGKLGELKIGGDKVSVRGSGGLRAVVLFKFFGSLGNKRRLRKKKA
jgi:methylase of polypeptide subunit release factors